jgi:phosphate transport system substrate-binding protein
MRRAHPALLATAVAIALLTEGAASGAPAPAPAGAAAPTAATGRSHLAVIVNRSNPIASLSRRELRALFLGDKTAWSHGRRVTVVLREPGQPERSAALRLIYGMSEADLTRHFLHQTFNGSSGAGPRTLATSDGVKRFVFNVPGAIGLVRLADVDDTVKVVSVDGMVPGDAAYGLLVGEP